MKVLITISESLSRIKDDKPSSRAKEIALAVAKASTISEENGSGIKLEREAITCPCVFQITIPRPTFSISLKVAPSKFTLSVSLGGGLHRTQ